MSLSSNSSGGVSRASSSSSPGPAHTEQQLTPLQSASPSHITAGSGVKVTHFPRRYTKNQQRALERLYNSKRVFNYTTQIEDDEILLRIFEGVGTTPTRDDDAEEENEIKGVKIVNAFEAAREGALPKLKKFIEKKGFDPRSHDDAKGGSTVLHYAAWGGNVAVLQYLIHYVRMTFGERELVAFVNSWDTVHHRSTALIEACRSNIGIVSERLECIRDLIDAGADPGLQDASGDNCLHVAVRNSSLAIVRFLTRNQAALLASTATNGRVQKPIDIAAKKCGLKPPNYDHGPADVPHTLVSIFKLLQGLLISANLRLKMNALREKRKTLARRFRNGHNSDLMKLRTKIEVISARSWSAWDAQRTEAEELRNEERDVIREATKEKLPQHFEQLLQSQAGKAKLKQLTKDGMDEEKAIAKMKAEHKAEKVREVEEHFQTHNPPCPDWEEYLKSTA